MNCFRVSEDQALEFKACIHAPPPNVQATHERTSGNTRVSSEKKIGREATSLLVSTVTRKVLHVAMNLALFMIKSYSNVVISGH